jgi:hypothetical protein
VPGTTDQTIYDVLTALLTFAAAAYALTLLVRSLRRSRPGLTIGRPIAAALVVRVLITIGVTLTGLGQTLRGGDELRFIGEAHVISESPFGSAPWSDALLNELFKFVFASQILALDPPELALRITQAAIAVAGLALLAVAVYELAGPRPAVIAAWVLALEPTNIFFSTILHKEPNMMLAGGLVAFGGATMWNRADLRSLVPIIAGCLIAVATRPYAGWFLIAAGAAITLHAGLRAQRRDSVRAVTLVAIVIMFGAVAAPTVWEASTTENLAELQASQEANVSDEEANLSLERVDFSTRGAIFTHLHYRIRDVLSRPYPWQLDNTSQRFALLGTAVFLTGLVLLAQALWRNRGKIMDRAGPLVYVAFFLLIAYSLSAGNAGTAFRYRTHIVAVGLCVLIVLRFARERAPAAEPKPELAGLRGEPVPSA